MGYGMDEINDWPGDFEDEERSQTCNRCGVDELFWGKYGNGWRLFDSDGVLHSCPPKKKGK